MRNIAVILAAGEGTRMKSNRPKVLHEICGEAMITHIIKAANSACTDIKIVVANQADLVANAVLNEFKNAQICHQDIKNFPGTAGAVMAAMNSGDGDDENRVLILCGDMPLIKSEDLNKLLNSDGDINMAVFSLNDPTGYGRVILNNDSDVVKIVEQKDANEAERAVNLCNAGAYCFKLKALKEALKNINNDNASREFYLTDAVEIAIKNGYKVSKVEVSADDFMGVNDKAALALAEVKMSERIKNEWMKNGVKMQLPSTIFIDSRAKFVGECEVQMGAQILGKCVIENSIIKAHCVIESSHIINSDIGPMAHLRPGCEIKDSHIGNFVELKKASLNGVKAGHLSYLGDCEISSGTNIGCGTITCNYDGQKKHKTIIGKNVFVGSDVQLIAPVKIADNTIIAAGSTVTHDSQKGDLVVARSRQKNIAGYFYRLFGGKE